MRNPAPKSTPPLPNGNGEQAKAGAFTLLELLIVVAIIAILAGLVLQTAGYVQNRAARSLAQAQVAALSTALESYRIDNGQYPEGVNTSRTGNNAFLYAALAPTNRRVYYEFNERMLIPQRPGPTDTNVQVIDPFGDRFGYQFPGNPNRSGTNFFDLWSFAGSANNEEIWEKNW